jgi:splicing factor 3B subunit 5
MVNSKFIREWATNMKRDTLASHLGHNSRMNYFSVIENETTSRLKLKFINVFLSIKSK